MRPADLRASHVLSRLARDRSAVWVVVMCAVGLLSLSIAVLVGVAVWLIGWFGDFAGALPPPAELTARAPFQTSPMLASDGSTVLFDITDPNGGRRTVINLSQMRRYLIEATIATEDPGFFSNPGFEVRSILRAAFEDLSHGHIMSGASTITQQVARNVLLTPQERMTVSARRKVKEIVIAYQLTQTYTKNEILDVYLNQINYGNHSYGVEAAAEGYFGKSAAQLDLAESAMIAGLPASPYGYDPYRNFQAAKNRQEYVLSRMVDQGYITKEQAQAAAREPLHLVGQRHALIAPHFVNHVVSLLIAKLGTQRLYHDGDHAITTLNVPLQKLAERAITSNRTIAATGAANNAALIALDPRTGSILAMVGSADFDDPAISGQVNMALAQHRSNGILTPLTYALALQHGETLTSEVIDQPVDTALSGGTVLNNPADSHHYLGRVSLRQAIGLGLAAPALQLLDTYGSQSLVDLMTRSGITDFGKHAEYTPNLVIAGASVSPLEVAQAYAMLANAGTARPPFAIREVVTPNGQTVYQSTSKPTVALSPGIAYLVTAALTDPAVRPPAVQRALAVDQTVAVHASTSDDQRESWAAAYVPNLAVVVWAGNMKGQPLQDPNVATEILGSFVDGALKQRPSPDFTRPADVALIALCQDPGCTQRQTVPVLQGTEKAAEDANAKAIQQTQTGVTASETPLVNRSQFAAEAGAATAQRAMVTVPDVSGESIDQARRTLAAIGLDNAPFVNYVSRADLPQALRDTPDGAIIGTSPAAGSQAAPGTAVILTVRHN